MKHFFLFLVCFLFNIAALAKSDIDVFYGTDNGYIIHTGVSVASILKNASDEQNFRFHILTDKSVTQETRKEFEALQKIKPHFLEFIDVDETLFQKLKKYKGSRGTYYRFMIPLVSDVDKALYLDGDTIIRGNLQELWDTDISNSYIAAIPDYPERRVKNAMDTLKLDAYFNAGVLLFNLKKIREDGLADLFFETMNTIPNVNGWGDQNVMNYLFGKKSVYLSQKYNWYERFGFNNDAIIAHFIDGKPWNGISSYAGEYWRIRQETPWALPGKKIILENMMDFPKWKEYFVYQDSQKICPERNQNLTCYQIMEEDGSKLILLTDDNRKEKYRLKDNGIYTYSPD